MKKLLFVMLLLVAPALFAAPVKPIKPTLEQSRAIFGQKLSPKMGKSHENQFVWDKFGPVDPSWGYTLKVTTLSCKLIPGENCIVLGVSFIGGSEDEGRCYTVKTDEINTYPNLKAANHTANFCARQPQFHEWQKFVDPDGDNVYTAGPYIRYDIAIVKTQL